MDDYYMRNDNDIFLIDGITTLLGPPVIMIISGSFGFLSKPSSLAFALCVDLNSERAVFVVVSKNPNQVCLVDNT